MRGRRARLGILLLGGALALGLAAGYGRPRLERALRARIEGEAARRGLVARVATVRIGLRPLLRLTGVRLERPGSWSVATDSIEARLRLFGSGLRGRVRLALGRVTLRGPAGLEVEAVPTAWDVVSADARRAELREPASGLALVRPLPDEGSGVTLVAADLPAGRLLGFRHGGMPLLDAGILTGSLRLRTEPGHARFDVDLAGRGVRGPVLSSNGGTGDDAFGQPTDLTLRLVGSWAPAEGALELPRWRLTIDGAAISGSLTVCDVATDPGVDLSLDVERVDFARLLRTSGLVPAESDLGSASLSARAHGRLGEPGSFSVTQRLDFSPPRRVPPALERLRGDFVHEVALPDGKRLSIDVSPSSPDFIALADVPPLFLRALLLAEDAAFYGHRGIDLRELPSALITNWTRGTSARGASTITQQLAKNLFLSRDKRLGRKLQELSLALLLESTLGKDRILEIYLNVIEWGPGIHGLRPAARTYFGREPRELTPAQAAFLVCLIPGPVKYQSSFAHGTLVPGFRQLVDALLGKLRAAEALSEDQYGAALAEEIIVEVPAGPAP